MQLLIHTENDIKFLQGKFVIQLDFEKPDFELVDFKWEFAKEKRLYMVSGYGFVDLFGNKRDYETFEKFKNVFNNYLFEHMIKEGKKDGGRFHRLLTNKELNYLVEKLKLENY